MNGSWTVTNHETQKITFYAADESIDDFGEFGPENIDKYEQEHGALLAVADPDGDGWGWGWGWENGRTCLVVQSFS